MQDPGTRLLDNHGRDLNYLRLAVTDRCNLRCFYCMPEEGIRYLPKKELLTFEEIERLVRLLASMGISKIRLTGGEPFVRTDLMVLIRRLTEIPGIRDIHITTNGVLTAPLVPELKALGIASVNLSLDTLDRERFRIITRRDSFDRVMKCFDSLLHHDIPFKINTVVMQDRNIDDIVPLASLTRDHPIDVRFIEEMPFNGEGTHYPELAWTHLKIFDHLRSHFPNISKIPDPAFATANHYQVPGHQGRIGIIAAFSRTFCGTCNRIRVTAQGTLRTCLYDDGTLDLKTLLRSTTDDGLVRQALLRAFGSRAIDGFEAEARRGSRQPATESMSTIGG
ncbi:MAG TPA: GTP 3',8-cyclase MoaA [Cyclobacteriaceae bacterium]|nr:GTP 3',8-cyclase MoaA [Cyclobacteriaceae bacterium]